MTITGQEERDSIPFDEVSRDQHPDEYESDLDDATRDEDEYSEVTETSDDDDDYDFGGIRESAQFHVTSTPTKGDQLVPSSVHIITPSSHRNRTSFSRRQLHHLEMLFRETQYPSQQQVTNLAQTQGIDNEKSIKMWFQNRRARFRKMPRLSPVKPLGGSTIAHYPMTTGGSSGNVRQARTFSPIVIQPRASSSDSSTRSTPSPRSSAVKTSTPVARERSFQPLNVSSSSAESCEESQPPKKTEVKNKDEYKAMTMTTLPPDHPFCKLTHGSSTRSKRKVVRDNLTPLHEPPAKMARRELLAPSSPSRFARRRSSHHGVPSSRQQAPSPNTLNQLPIGFIPAWPAALPLPSALIPPPSHNNNNNSLKDKNNSNSNNKDNSGAPIDLSKKTEKSENVKREKANKEDDSTVVRDNRPHILPPTGGLPIIPPYFSFPMMGMPGQIQPYMPPTGAGATPFMVPMFTGALPGVYGNPAALWAQHPAHSNAQKSS